jgi:hypothetical protein
MNMMNLNQNIGIGQAVKLLGIREIGTYPTPIGEVHMFYEGNKVVVAHYDAYGEYQGRDVYDTYDEAREETARAYY